MSQHLRYRDRVGKAPHRTRRQQPRPVRHSDPEPRHNKDWVALPLLSAIDDVERHVQEMLDHDPHLGQAVPSSSASTFDVAELKAYIMRKVKRRMEEKVNDIVDTVIVARMQRLEASRRADKSCIDELQAAGERNDQTVRELDALHRHEHTLNTALVDRLFNIPPLAKGHPETRFSDTTFGLKGTDSVNSVLVSHVEVLVMKVQRLEEVVKRLQVFAKRKSNSS